jgi:hypothetical protein
VHSLTDQCICVCVVSSRVERERKRTLLISTIKLYLDDTDF